jgi:HPt (histidine-containing phosphotransfer) domain-containing protein
LIELARNGRGGEIAVIVHRLAGAAETFGHAEVGRIATSLDDQFIAAEKRGSSAPGVTSLVDALTRAIEDG